jgi:hypothetical protein
MKRARVAWSNWVDSIEGPCVVCGKDVYFVVPSSRPDPAILYHITCDVMPKLREQLLKAKPPLMPSQYVISKPKPAPKPVTPVAPPPAAVSVSPQAAPPSAETPIPPKTPHPENQPAQPKKKKRAATGDSSFLSSKKQLLLR